MPISWNMLAANSNDGSIPELLVAARKISDPAVGWVCGIEVRSTWLSADV